MHRPLMVFVLIGAWAAGAPSESVLGQSPAGQSPAQAWREGFETYQAGQPLAGQSRWQHGRPERTDEPTALVVRSDAMAGRQAVAIFQDHPDNRAWSISHDLEPRAGVVWVEAHVRPPKTPTTPPALDVLDGRTPVTHLGFAADGKDVVFSSYERSYWRVFREFPAAESRWYRLTERIDFPARTWSLWVDGKLHSQDLPLPAGAGQVTGIRVTAGGTEEEPALVDELYVGPAPPDDVVLPAAFPPRGPGHLFRFALFGDPQIGFGDRQPPHARDVVRLKAAICQAEAAGCELVLCAGDLVHETTDVATAGLRDALATFTKATWCPVPGNHDPDPWYREHIRQDLDYCLEHRGVTLIGMKTWGPEHQGAVTPEQLAWLEERLRDARAKDHEIIVWCHVTPYGPNPRGWWIRDGQPEMLDLCKRYRVLAVLAGHFHRELWHFEQDGTHHVIAPGITYARGPLGLVIYDVYPDRVVQHFKPLWSGYEAEGQSEDHVVHGPLTFTRHAPVSAPPGK